MVQDEKGQWYYFFWGPESETVDKSLVTWCANGCFFVPVNTNDCDLTTPGGVRKALNQTFDEGDKRNRANLISDVKYFTGDYTKTAQYVSDISNSGDEYKVLTWNCAQINLIAFEKSDWRFSIIRQSVIPNEVYRAVVLMPSKKGKFPWLLFFFEGLY